MKPSGVVWSWLTKVLPFLARRRPSRRSRPPPDPVRSFDFDGEDTSLTEAQLSTLR